MTVWAQLWPNLLANAVWAPPAAAWAWAHWRWSRRHMQILRDHITALHRQNEELLVHHILGGSTAEQEAAGARPVMKGPRPL